MSKFSFSILKSSIQTKIQITKLFFTIILVTVKLIFKRIIYFIIHLPYIFLLALDEIITFIKNTPFVISLITLLFYSYSLIYYLGFYNFYSINILDHITIRDLIFLPFNDVYKNLGIFILHLFVIIGYLITIKKYLMFYKEAQNIFSNYSPNFDEMNKTTDEIKNVINNKLSSKYLKRFFLWFTNFSVQSIKKEFDFHLIKTRGLTYYISFIAVFFGFTYLFIYYSFVDPFTTGESKAKGLKNEVPNNIFYTNSDTLDNHIYLGLHNDKYMLFNKDDSTSMIIPSSEIIYISIDQKNKIDQKYFLNALIN